MEKCADRSPFHTDYIRNNLDDKKKEDVRLLRSFYNVWEHMDLKLLQMDSVDM